MLQSLINLLEDGVALNPGQVGCAIQALTDESITPAEKANFLTALAKKGETTEEIAAFAERLLARAIAVPLSSRVRAGEILDVCGTGGDRLTTFNISTTVGLLVAAGDVLVAKHGNRAITSQWGSADVLEELGISVTHSPADAAQILEKKGFVFLFAPLYHPAFKHIGPARKLCNERGQRTIFNFLGPLLNPARPTAQLLGVPRPELCPAFASVLRSLGVRQAMVVCGETPAGMLDEFSTLGPTHVSETYHERGLAHSVVDAGDFGMQRAELKDLQGGDRHYNAEIIRRILDGREEGPKKEAVLINAGAAFFVARKVKSISEGIAFADDLIRSGKAAAKLKQLVAP